VSLEKYFVEEGNLDNSVKEVIVKGDDWKIRYKGRIIVSQEKDIALEYYLCCVYGAVDSNGVQIPERMPDLVIFVDDSDLNILAVVSRFQNSHCLNVPLVSVFYEPTLEMFSHNPMDGDNPKPGCLEQVYQLQIENHLKLEENVQLIKQVYASYSLPVPNKYQ